MAKWKLCIDNQPDEATTVMVAEPYQSEVRPAEYVLVGENKIGTWFLANTNDEIWPTMWKPLPPHPMITD